MGAEKQDTQGQNCREIRVNGRPQGLTDGYEVNGRPQGLTDGGEIRQVVTDRFFFDHPQFSIADGKGLYVEWVDDSHQVDRLFAIRDLGNYI
jgi:hypothetical protein